MRNNTTSLTSTQKAVLDYIASFISNRGYPPSLTDIATNFSHTKATAQHYVAELEKKGYLRKGKHKTRALVVNESEVTSIPKLGYIAAGEPIEAIEEPGARQEVSGFSARASGPGDHDPVWIHIAEVISGGGCCAAPCS